MSKYVKEPDHRRSEERLDGVDDALLVNVVGMDANANVELRQTLREKNINLMVVKNSLARRATEGTVAGAGVRGSRRARRPWSGVAKTSSRWPRK